jgi:hypothetical protein
MKQILRRELTNIVFIVLIVASAVVIYLLSRAENGGQAKADSPETTAFQNAQTESTTAEPDETPVPASAAEAKASSRGVPEAVFQTHLATSGSFSAKQKGQKKQYELTYGGKDPITSGMTYQLENGCIASLEFTFQLPYQPDSKSKSEIDAQLREIAEEKTLALTDAVGILLGDLLPAADAKDELQDSFVDYWAEQVMLLKKSGDDFKDTQGGYRFLAYRRDGDVFPELVCVLYLS